MPRFEIGNNAPIDSSWNKILNKSEFKSQGRLVDKKGKMISFTAICPEQQYRISSKFVRNLTNIERGGRGFLGTLPVIGSLALAFFSTPLALTAVSCTLGAIYFSKSYRDLFTKQKETIRLEQLDESHQFIGAECKSLDIGTVRKGDGNGTPPSFIGKGPSVHFREAYNFSEQTVIDTYQAVAAGFAACFHTTESQEKILETFVQIYRGLKIDLNPNRLLRGEPLDNLHRCLARLIKALPGQQTTKEIKIYWNECAEKQLIPHFFETEYVNVEDLVFAIVPGEESEAIFQAEKMDFNHQLQFIGIGKEKIFTHLKDKIESLSLEIFGRNIYPKLQEIQSEPEHSSPLIDQAYKLTFQKKVIDWLLSMHNKTPAPDLSIADMVSIELLIKG